MITVRIATTRVNLAALRMFATGPFINPIIGMLKSSEAREANLRLAAAFIPVFLFTNVCEKRTAARQGLRPSVGERSFEKA
jgi:hypothetical protein